MITFNKFQQIKFIPDNDHNAGLYRAGSVYNVLYLGPDDESPERLSWIRDTAIQRDWLVRNETLRAERRIS